MTVGLVLLGAASGCGGGSGDDDGDDDGDDNGPGTVTAPWDAYCVATFTEDTAIDDFGEPLFTAKAGEAYLMTAFDTFSGVRADMVYLTRKGPYPFTLSLESGQEPPFTSNCTVDQGVRYHGAFTDVAVYAEPEFKTELCDLKSGTVAPSTETTSGHFPADTSLVGPSTYEVYLNAFAPSCGNAESGYVSVPRTEVFGASTWLVPIIQFLGPP